MSGIDRQEKKCLHLENAYYFEKLWNQFIIDNKKKLTFFNIINGKILRGNIFSSLVAYRGPDLTTLKTIIHSKLRLLSNCVLYKISENKP